MHVASREAKNNVSYWVIPEKVHTPPMDGMLEILAGGGVEGSGNLGGRGGLNQKILPRGSFSTRT